MFDIVGARATPQLARKLMEYSKHFKLDLDPSIPVLAQQDLLAPFTNEVGQQVVQNLADRAFRGMIVEEASQKLAFEGLLDYLKLIEHPNVRFVVPGNAPVKKDLDLLEAKIPGQYRVHKAKEHIELSDAFIIYICSNWGSRHLEMAKWSFGTSQIIGYHETPKAPTLSFMHGVLFYHDVLVSNSHTSIADLLKDKPVSVLPEMLKVFGINCVGISNIL